MRRLGSSIKRSVTWKHAGKTSLHSILAKLTLRTRRNVRTFARKNRAKMILLPGIVLEVRTQQHDTSQMLHSPDITERQNDSHVRVRIAWHVTKCHEVTSEIEHKASFLRRHDEKARRRIQNRPSILRKAMSRARTYIFICAYKITRSPSSNLMLPQRYISNNTGLLCDTPWGKSYSYMRTYPRNVIDNT